MLGKFFRSFFYRPFSSRVVRDHLIEQKMKKMMLKPDPKENTSETEDISDFEDYRSKILHRSDMINKKYDKKIDKDEADLKDHDYFHLSRQFRKNVDDYLKNDNLNIDPLDEQRKEKTKKILRSIKINSTFEYVREKNLDKVTDEYNNYSKFDRNFTYYQENTKNQFLDKGDMNLSAKVKDYMGKIGKVGQLDNDYRTFLKISDTLGKNITQDQVKNLIKEDEAISKAYQNNSREYFENTKGHIGRMSPHAREDIYKLYSNGWSIKDISLKYGILPIRASAIVWCRRYFHDVIAPQFGRTFWRLGLEREMFYAFNFPFVDYGLDFDLMAHFEKGLDYVNYGNTPIDINPPKEVIEKVKNAIQKLPKRRAYTIHRGTVGTGFKKYDIKDIVIRGGNGKLDVSEMFKRICYRGDLTPHSFPKKVRERLHLGPRIASLGYRVGPRSNRPIRFYNKEYHSQ